MCLLVLLFCILNNTMETQIKQQIHNYIGKQVNNNLNSRLSWECLLCWRHKSRSIIVALPTIELAHFSHTFFLSFGNFFVFKRYFNLITHFYSSHSLYSFSSLHNGRNNTSSASGRPPNQHPPVWRNRQDRPQGLSRHLIHGVPPSSPARQSSRRGVRPPDWTKIRYGNSC
jgi:hypothetical protein